MITKHLQVIFGVLLLVSCLVHAAEDENKNEKKAEESVNNKRDALYARNDYSVPSAYGGYNDYNRFSSFNDPYARPIPYDRYGSSSGYNRLDYNRYDNNRYGYDSLNRGYDSYNRYDNDIYNTNRYSRYDSSYPRYDNYNSYNTGYNNNGYNSGYGGYNNGYTSYNNAGYNNGGYNNGGYNNGRWSNGYGNSAGWGTGYSNLGPGYRDDYSATWTARPIIGGLHGGGYQG